MTFVCSLSFALSLVLSRGQNFLNNILAATRVLYVIVLAALFAIGIIALRRGTTFWEEGRTLTQRLVP